MFDFKEYVEENFDPKPQQTDPDQMSIHCINPDCDDNWRRHYKMTVNVEQKRAFCFKCNAKLSDIEFVAMAEGITKFAALKIVRAAAPIRTYGATRLTDALAKLKAKPEPEEVPIDAKPCRLPPLIKIKEGTEEWEYLKKRRISQEVIDHFALSYSNFGPYVGRIIIPIYRDGILISFQARTIRGANPKYLFPIDQPFGSDLYNWDDAKCFGTIIITEGVTDAWRVWDRKFHNVTATFGKSLKASQEKIIKMEKMVKRVIFCWDGGTLADSYAAGMRLAASKEVLIATLPPGEDPDECPDVTEYINAAKPIQSFSRLEVALSKKT